MAMTRSFSVLCLLAATSAYHAQARELDDALAEDAAVEIIEEPVQAPEPKGFMETVRDMQKRWRAHKQLQMQTLEPWKVKEYEEKKMRHRAERAQVERRSRQEAMGGEAAKGEQRSAEDQLVLDEEKKSNETKKVEKFGEQLTFVVQDMSGEEFKVKFRAKTHMRVLMQSIFQHLMLTPEEVAQVKIMFGSKEITSYDTAESLGMHDQDVIALKGELMEKKALRKRAATARERAKAHLAAKADSARSHERMFAARRSIEKQRRLQAVKDQEALKRHFRENQLIHLNFTDGHGKSVRLGVKREHWLGPAFKIACKRLGFLPEATHFKADVDGTTTIIKPDRTVNELGLREDAVITVKNNRRYSTPVPVEGQVEGPMV